MKLHWKVWHQALPRKCETRMEVTNALAYYVVVITTTIKSFLSQTQMEIFERAGSQSIPNPISLRFQFGLKHSNLF
jgi:hypothetical protein